MKRNINVLILLGFLGFFFFGCQPKGLDIQFASSDVLIGSIGNLGSLGSQSLLANCQTNKVELFALNEQGEKDYKITEVNPSVTGEFQFSDLKNRGVSISHTNNQSTSYLLEFECGSILYKRFVTNTKNQQLNEVTTLFAWLTTSEIRNKIISKSTGLWQSFFDSLDSSTSQAAVFSALIANPELSSRFSEAFGVAPTVLLNASPELRSAIVPSSVNEGQSQSFSVQVAHWSPSYSPAYQWKLGSQVLSHDSNFTYTPSANSQGDHTLQLFIGQNNGLGQVDIAKPFKLINYDLKILNTEPAIAPLVSRLSPEYTLSNSAQIRLNTGALIDGRPTECRSFSKLALVEDTFPGLAPAPLLPSSYNLDCTSANTQDVTVTLSGVEGVRLIRLWAQDAQGNISSVSSDISLVYDVTSPSLTLLSLNGGEVLAGGKTLNINWSNIELNPAVNPIQIFFSQDNGITWSPLTARIADSGSYSWTLPSADTSDALIRITSIDRAGNASQTTSTSSFVIDSTPPNPPAITRASGAISNSLTTTLTVTCLADHHKVLLSSSVTQPSSDHLSWQSCAPVMNHVVSNGDGLKNIYIWSKDLAGNVSTTSNSVNMTLDQTQPTLSFLGPHSGTLKGASTISVLWSASDTHLHAQPISVDISADNGSSWTSLASSLTNSGSATVTLPSLNSNQTRLRVTAIDQAGNMTQQISSSAINLDSSAPTVTSIIINDNAATTSSQLVNIKFSASESVTTGSSLSTHLCLKYRRAAEALPTAPTLLTDACWINLNGSGISPALTMTNEVLTGFRIPAFSSDTYFVHAWARDGAGNISSTQSSDDIQFIEPVPSSINNVVATNTDSPTSPPTLPESNVPSGSVAYIKWKVIEGTVPLAANPIRIRYSVSGIDWTEIAAGAPKINGANGSCAIDGNYSGCYTWTNSVGTTSFKIRVEATDENGVVVSADSGFLNPGNYRHIAGNTSIGLNGSAQAAMFRPNASYSRHRLAIDSQGVVYFSEPDVGITKVDPVTGEYSLIIKKVSSGQVDGSIGTANTTSSDNYLAIDYQDGLIWADVLNQKIRRYDPSTSSVTTLVGGGALSASGSLGVDFNLSLTSCLALTKIIIVPMSNGDIYYVTCNGGRKVSQTQLVKYQASDQKVYLTSFNLTSGWKMDSSYSPVFQSSIDVSDYEARTVMPLRDNLGLFSGVLVGVQKLTAPTESYWVTTNTSGESLPQSQSLPSCNFSVWIHGCFLTQNFSGQVMSYTELGGRTFFMNKGATVPLVQWGSNVGGVSADGTVLTSSTPINISDYVFDRTGKVYLLERGRIRYVDSNGRIQQLYGQDTGYGNDGPALSSRFADVQSIDRFSNGDIAVMDFKEYSIRRVHGGTGAISLIAGNRSLGSIVAGGLATNSSIYHSYYAYNFSIDPISDSLYSIQSLGNLGVRLVRLATDQIWNVLGFAPYSGNKYYYDPTAEGTSYSGIALYSNGVESGGVIGLNSTDGKILIAMRQAKNVTGDNRINSMLKSYNLSTGIQTHIAGIFSGMDHPYTEGIDNTSFSADGTLATSSAVPTSSISMTRATWDGNNLPANGGPQWVVSARGTSRIVGIPTTPGGTIKTVATLPMTALNFHYFRKAGIPTIYFCREGVPGGQLYRFTITNESTGAGTNTLLQLPGNLLCYQNGRSMYWEPLRSTIVFPVIENGKIGVGEFYDP